MTTPSLEPDDFASAPPLPLLKEAQILQALAAEKDGGGPLLERLIAQGHPIELTLAAAEKKRFYLHFDSGSAVLLVEDPDAAEAGLWRWRRLRRLVMRDLLLRNYSRRRAELQDVYPLLNEALRFPRPTLIQTASFPALAQLKSRCIAQLELGEAVTFDRQIVPSADALDSDALLQLRADIQLYLARLTSDQICAMIQDDLYEIGLASQVPTAFPMPAYSELSALVRHTNPHSRATVSLAVPVDFTLQVDMGEATESESYSTKAVLLYLELAPTEVMEVFRSVSPTQTALQVLEENGLSLSDLAIREARFDADDFQ